MTLGDDEGVPPERVSEGESDSLRLSDSVCVDVAVSDSDTDWLRLCEAVCDSVGD